MAQHFDDWREGQIDPFELTELIHQYHNGPARELWKRYVGNPYIELLMARAIAEGILEQADVSEQVRPYIKEAVERYRFMRDEGEASESA